MFTRVGFDCHMDIFGMAFYAQNQTHVDYTVGDLGWPPVFPTSPCRSEMRRMTACTLGSKSLLVGTWQLVGRLLFLWDTHMNCVCRHIYVYIYRLIVYTLVGCVYITDICIYSMYTHKNSVVLCPFWMIIPLWVRPGIDLMARYDVEWKDVNIVGDSEDAAKNVMDGAFMVICKEGASVFVVWYASYSQHIQ